MMSGFEMGGGWFGMGFWWILVIVVVGVVVWLTGRRSDQPQGADSPLEILKKRYARGEIKREEFDQMKRDLGA